MKPTLLYWLCSGLLLQAVAAVAAGAPPLALQLEPALSTVPQDRDIVLQVVHRVHRRLAMETVELNHRRSRITVQPLAPPGPATVLTGEDYVRREIAAGRWGPREVGRSFVAEAGDTWASEMSLTLFAPPLPLGRYRIQLSYRWGENESQVVTSNPVEVRVVAR